MDSKTPKFMGNKFVLGDLTYNLFDAVFLTFGTFKVNSSTQKGYAEENHPGNGKWLSVDKLEFSPEEF